PQRALAIGIDGPDPIVRQLRKRRVLLEPAVTETVDPAIRAHQHLAVAVFDYRTDPSIRETVFQVIVPEIRAIPSAEPARRANPQAARPILIERLKSVVAQPLIDREPRGFAVGDAHHAL